MKDTTYYNEESGKYSQKRYPNEAMNHTHFLFKRRLQLLIGFLGQINPVGKLLEIGCADGVVLTQLQKNFPRTKFLGVDISSGMIRVAQQQNSSGNIAYAMRDDSLIANDNFDVIVEVGVLNLTDFHLDFNFVSRVLKNNGYYICSLSARSSLVALLKPDARSAYRHLLSYREYETFLSEHFVIIQQVPYGLFIPHLWKIPVLARLIQPACDCLFGFIAPNLLHEKIYLLKKKNSPK